MQFNQLFFKSCSRKSIFKKNIKKAAQPSAASHSEIRPEKHACKATSLRFARCRCFLPRAFASAVFRRMNHEQHSPYYTTL